MDPSGPSPRLLSACVCPLVMGKLQKGIAEDRMVYAPRFRSVAFKSEPRSPLEVLSEAHDGVVKMLTSSSYMQIMFDLPTTLTARSASVMDLSNPKKKLPWGGLKLFRARMQSSNGDRHDMTDAPGELFWGTGSRPAVITGGIFFDRGSCLSVFCTPLVPDLEVHLGFWCVEQHRAGGYG